MKRIASAAFLTLLMASTSLAAELQYVSSPLTPYVYRLSTVTPGGNNLGVTQEDVPTGPVNAFSVSTTPPPGPGLTSAQAGLTNRLLRTSVLQASPDTASAPPGIARTIANVTPTQDLVISVTWDWTGLPMSTGNVSSIVINDITDVVDIGGNPSGPITPVFLVFSDINGTPLSGDTTVDLRFGRVYQIDLNNRVAQNGGGERLITSDIFVPVQPDCPGDTDGDLAVTVGDLLNVIVNLGATTSDGPAGGDLDGSGDVRVSDLLLVISNLGTSC